MIAPGTVLQNRYAVERQIGAGGMGAVYVATDRRFGSTVALKETFFDDPNLRKAFEREARLLNRLRHPALPRVSDHFEEAGGLVTHYDGSPFHIYKPPIAASNGLVHEGMLGVLQTP